MPATLDLLIVRRLRVKVLRSHPFSKRVREQREPCPRQTGSWLVEQRHENTPSLRDSSFWTVRQYKDAEYQRLLGELPPEARPGNPK